MAEALAKYHEIKNQDIKLHKSYITNVNLWFFNIKLTNFSHPQSLAAWFGA